MQVDTDTLLKTIGEQHVELNLIRQELRMASARITVYENAMRERDLDPDEIVAAASDDAMRRLMEQQMAAAEAQPEAAPEPEPEPARNGKGK